MQSPTAPTIQRDNYGVPHIKASTWNDAFFQAGYAVAQDRLWQMETSRRLARGQMAEAFGPSYIASDKETLLDGYTDAELDKQLHDLSPTAQAAMENYAKGVNAYIAEATANKTLPAGYANAGFTPRPWTAEDSVAICVRLFQLFGRGGADQLRDFALLTYLRSQPGAKGKELDIFDDLEWQNDAKAIPTLPENDDPQAANPPLRVSFTRADTEAQLQQLPQLSLLELLPAIQFGEKAESKKVAMSVHAPFKTGSYCVVVGPGKSAAEEPLLLSGPQMGFTTPSIVHEMSIEAPGVQVSGIDVPGVPGVVIGMTPHVSWGLTSGVADTEDIYYFPAAATGHYFYGAEDKALDDVKFNLKVKGQPDQTVDQQRTIFGPVVLHARNTYFVKRAAYAGEEMKSYDALLGLYNANTANDVDHTIARATMSFNFFFVTPGGDFGWRYLAKMPIRATGLDPRVPVRAEPKNDWKGFLKPDQMPHAIDPKQGFLANWNNKPASWWPNYDAPIWGRIFRNETLLDQLTKPKLQEQDLEMAAWSIARTDETAKYFRPYYERVIAPAGAPNGAEAARLLRSFDGRLMDGSISAELYLVFLNSLRTEVFTKTTGNFIMRDLFQLVLQPTVVLNALEKKTKVNYLGSRSVDEVVQAAFADTLQTLTASRGSSLADWAYHAPAIAVPGQPGIPYSNRGTYIQVIQQFADPIGRNALPPGEAESGEHAFDQVPLSRAWVFKPFGFGK